MMMPIQDEFAERMTTTGGDWIKHEDVRPKLLIIVASPLTHSIIRRIHVDELGEKLEVVVADCMAWVRKTGNGIKYKRSDKKNIVTIGSQKDFSRYLASYSPDYVLDFIGRGKYTRLVQKLCRMAGVSYITQLLTPVPTPQSFSSAVQLLTSSPWYTIKRIFSRIVNRCFSRAPFPPDIALLAGESSRNAWTRSAHTIIYTAAPAYYDVKYVDTDKGGGESAEISEISEMNGPYILFIDDCLGESFDFLIGDHKALVEPVSYYQTINRFFDKVEEISGKAIVIAGHPDGQEIEGYSSRFGGRLVEFQNTARLVRSCDFAMTHYSSATNYAVILKIPIVFLTFAELDASTYQGAVQRQMAKTLSARRIFIDRGYSFSFDLMEDVSRIDEAAYEKYYRRYISNCDNPPERIMDPLVSFLLSISSTGKTNVVGGGSLK